MLHSRLRGRQVHGWLPALLLGLAGALAPAAPAAASRADDLAAADAHARGGRHAEAAGLYEQRARRALLGVDTRIALLAAREYLRAGRLDDAGRLLELAGTPTRADDRVLAARVTAELALARGRPEAALAALEQLREPWPAPLAAELLALRAQAEFESGRTLEAVRTVGERDRILSAPEDRRANHGWLVESLAASPAATATVPATASAEERAWFELGQLLSPAAQADAVAAERRAQDWRNRHPNHPGSAFLPEPTRPLSRAMAAGAIDPGASVDRIALLLPLSGRQAATGVAVRDGFLAAALGEPAGRRPRIEVFDTAAAGAVAAYQQALESGARAVAGPLLKPDVAVIAAGTLPVPTLALNSLPGDAPPFLFQFSLDPEQEAREAARRIVRDGHVRGIALFPRSSWGDRLREAFTDELRSGGVQLTGTQAYEPGSNDFQGPLRAALGRYGGAGDRDAKGNLRPRDGAAEALAGPQFAFIAATPRDARALRPQLRFQMAYGIAVYATSDAWDPGPRAVPDLDGLMLPEMPWILHAGDGAPALWDALQGDWAAAGRGRLRLYAFGFDAYRLLRGLDVAARGVPMDGLTGRLAVGSDGRVQRETGWGQVQGGHLQPAGFAPGAPPAGGP